MTANLHLDYVMTVTSITVALFKHHESNIDSINVKITFGFDLENKVNKNYFKFTFRLCSSRDVYNCNVI